MRESKVEAYLKKRVKEVGGISRKFVSPGHIGVPDQIVILSGTVFFVEVKAPGEKLRDTQKREHKKFNSAGAQVLTISDMEMVDNFLHAVFRMF